MDKKYIRGQVAISSQEIWDGLEEIAAHLRKQFGFEPSRSEVVAYLVNFWKQNQPKP